MPADLEAQLLATIPAAVPIPPRRRAAWVVGLAASTAACLLAVLAWLGREDKGPIPAPGTTSTTDQARLRPPDEAPGIAAWLEARQGLNELDQSTFSWPLSEASILTAKAIPADLLD